jgi:hypothetical protein
VCYYHHLEAHLWIENGPETDYRYLGDPSYIDSFLAFPFEHSAACRPFCATQEVDSAEEYQALQLETMGDRGVEQLLL